MHRLKSAILAILQKSADWLDWPALLVQPSKTAHRFFFLFYIFILFIFLNMETLSDVVPGLLSFRSRSKQFVTPVKSLTVKTSFKKPSYK